MGRHHMDAGAARGETKTRADTRQAKHRGKHWAKMLGLRPGVCNAVLAGLLSASMVMQMVPAQALAEIGNEAAQQAPIEAPAVTDAPATEVDAGADDTQDAAATDAAEPQKNADKVAHVLHLDANGATGRGDASADAVADGRAMDDVVTDAAKDDDAWTVEVPASTLVRDGYHLTGWSTTPDGKDAVDDPATAWDETLPATDVPLKTKLTNWTFELDTDGDDTAESFDLAYAAKTPEELAEEGAFDEDGLLAEDEAFEDGELRDDDAATVEVVTLYAQWEKDAEPAADDSDAKANAASANTDGKTDEQSVAEDDDKNSTADATESEQNAASEGEDEKADEDVATIPETVTSDTDPAEQAAEGEQADTDAADASDNDAPTMAPEQYSVAGIAMPSAFTPVLKVLGLARRAPAIDPDHDVTAGDNVTIDAVTSTWKTADNTDPVATDDVLNYRFPNDANTSLRMDLDFTVSGDLPAGSVRVVLPEGFIPRRGSTSDSPSYVGSMSFSVPEDPDTGGQFNYSLVDGQYVLTSTRAFTGTTSVHLEFSVDGVKPDQIANGTVTDPFQPQVQVTTTEGTALQRTSNALTAQFTTWEAIAASYEYGQFLKDAPVAWGEGTAPALPEGKTAEDYIYVDWYSYCAVTGNQPYDLNFVSKVADYTITNKANGEAVDSSSAIIMGVTTPAANDAVNKDLGAAAVNLDTRVNHFEPNDSMSWNQYQHVYVAYPKDLFASNTQYKLTHKSQWTLSPNETTTTDVDGKQVQYTQASLTLNNVTYYYQDWEDPTGFFDVFKWGVDSNGSYSNPDSRYGHVGAYSFALNRLAKGDDVDLTYGIQEQAGLYGWTYDTEQGKESSYGKTPVTVELSDTGTYFGSDYAHPLSADQRVVKSVRFASATTYNYTRGSDGKFSYKRDSLLEQPIFTVYGRADADSEWISYGTMQGGKVQTTENGASGEGTASITLPEGEVTDWKLVTDKTVPAIIMNVWPTVTLKAAGTSDDGASTLQERAASIVASATDESVYVSNRAELRATGAHGEDTGTILKYGTDKLGAASWGVQSSTTTTSVTNDTSNQQVNIHYKTDVTEPSNLASKDDYQAAVDERVIQQDKGGRFYVLLPQGVEPDTSSVKASNGDSVESVQTVTNWRGSGRTMMIVTVAHTPNPHAESGRVTDRITIEYDAHCSWMDATQYRNLNQNAVGTVAYESGLDQLGTMTNTTGEPDDPTHGNNYQSANVPSADVELVTGLDSDRKTDEGSTPNAFVYSASTANVKDLKFTYVTGFSKSVMVQGQGTWGDGRSQAMDVYAGGAYKYSLAASPKDKDTTSSNVVIYDKLEAYKPSVDSDDAGERKDADSATWQGTLLGVDTSRIEALGAAPKVYYSEQDVTLDYENGTLAGDTDLTDGNVWVEAGTYAQTHDDLSAVRAVAVDASKKTDGSSLTLRYGDFAVAYLTLRAPAGEDVDYTAHAFNNAYVTSNVTNAKNDQDNAPTVTPSGYTKLGVQKMDIPVTKAWSDAKDQDGLRPDSVTVHLYANGEDKDKTLELSADNDWKGTFENLTWGDDEGNQIAYTVVEDPVKGYTPSVAQASTAYTVTNVHKPATVRFRGTKAWDDQDDAQGARPASVTLHLLADGKVVKTVTATAGKGWAYDFGDMPKYGYYANGKGGRDIAYTVTEDYVPGYVSDTTNHNAVSNRYDPYGDVSVTKKVTNATAASADAEFPMTLTVTKDNQPVSGSWDYEVKNADGTVAADADGDALSGTLENGGTVKLTADQTLTVHGIPSDTDYVWSEGEVAGFRQASTSNLRGTILAGQTQVATITNNYQTKGSAVVKANKVLTGRKLTNRQFRFLLTDGSGNAVKSGTSDADGNVVFSALKYTNADDDKTYTYYMREVNANLPGYTYDGSSHKVTVTPHDNGDGTMSCDITYADGQAPTFNNRYQASGSTRLSAYKTITGGDVKGGQFKFTLHAQDGAPKPSWNPSSEMPGGAIEFPTIYFSEKDAGKTYVYWATEDAGKDPTINYTTEPVAWTVKVVDNGDGTLSFTTMPVKTDGLLDADGNLNADFKPQPLGDAPTFVNTYKDGELDISKYVQGWGDPDNPDQEFTFRVELEGEQVDDDTVKSYQISNGSETYGTANSEAKAQAASAASQQSSTEVKAASLPDMLASGLDMFAAAIDSIFGATEAYAAETAPADAIASGTWGTCPWWITKEGVLHVEAGTADANQSPWSSYDSQIVAVAAPSDNGKVIYSPKWLQGALFSNCKNLKDISGLKNWDVTGATDFRNMFSGCTSLTDVSALSDWDTSRVTDMSWTFENCSSLTNLKGLEKWDVSNVGLLWGTFEGCKGLADVTALSEWKPMRASMRYMFAGCSSIVDASSLSGWDTSNASDISFMFEGCSSLKIVDFSNWAIPYSSGVVFKDCPIERITFGTNAKNFRGSTGGNSYWLNDPSTTSPYTGKWVREDGSGACTTNELIGLTGSGPASIEERAGTWVWQAEPYTITFDANGGKGSMASENFDSNFAKALTTNAFTRFGYRFTGWNTETDGSGTSYADGQVVKVDKSMKLYAQWEARGTSVSNGRSFEVTIKNGETAKIDALPAGTKYKIYEETPDGWVLLGSYNTPGVIKPNNTSYVTFVNSYQPGKTTAIITGTKTMDGSSATEKTYGYTFDIAATGDNAASTPMPSSTSTYSRDLGAFAFNAITYTEPGTYTYAVTEHDYGRQNIKYDKHTENVTVKVTKDDKGNLAAAVDTDADGIVFDNHDTTPTTGSLTIEKKVPLGDATDVKFTFDVTISTNGKVSHRTANITGAGSTTIDGIPGGSSFKVTETDVPKGWQNVSGTPMGVITAGKTSTVQVTNIYPTVYGTADIEVTKAFDGGNLENGQFFFVLQNVKNGSDYRVANNQKDGTVHFSHERLAPGEYIYSIFEPAGNDYLIKYSTERIYVKVTVTDNGDGTASSTVAYYSDAACTQQLNNPTITNSVKTGSLTISKTTTNATETADGKATFSFGVTLSDASGKPVSGTFGGVEFKDGKATVTVDAKGGKGKTTVKGLPAGTTYTVTEEAKGGWNQTGAEADAGTIGANAESTASFANDYATAGAWTPPTVTKKLTGRELAEGEFTFVLRDSDGNVVDKAANAADGTVNFADLTYATEDDDVAHEYTISEEQGAASNVSYATDTVYAVVTPHDQGDGTMTMDAHYYADAEHLQELSADALVFENEYGVALPNTGRGGFIGLTVAALAAVAGAAAVIVRRKREEDAAAPATGVKGGGLDD